MENSVPSSAKKPKKTSPHKAQKMKCIENTPATMQTTEQSNNEEDNNMPSISLNSKPIKKQTTKKAQKKKKPNVDGVSSISSDEDVQDSDGADIDESDFVSDNNGRVTSLVRVTPEMMIGIIKEGGAVQMEEESPSTETLKKIEDGCIVLVCGLAIDIERITDTEMYTLRRVLPRKEYRLLKNRKSARKSRRRRKAELTCLREEVKQLKEECEKWRKIAEPFIKQQQQSTFNLPFLPSLFKGSNEYNNDNSTSISQVAVGMNLVGSQQQNEIIKHEEIECPSILKPKPVNPLSHLIDMPLNWTQQIKQQLPKLDWSTQFTLPNLNIKQYIQNMPQSLQQYIPDVMLGIQNEQQQQQQQEQQTNQLTTLLAQQSQLSQAQQQQQQQITPHQNLTSILANLFNPSTITQSQLQCQQVRVGGPAELIFGSGGIKMMPPANRHFVRPPTQQAPSQSNNNI